MPPLMLLFGLGVLLGEPATPRTPDLDLAHLREVLQDRQDPRGQSQAALLLVQSSDPAPRRSSARACTSPRTPRSSWPWWRPSASARTPAS